MLRTVLCCCLLALGTILPACAASEPVDPTPPSELSAATIAPEPLPPDFTLAVTVYGPARLANNMRAQAALPPSRRPARYVLETDGMLRVALGSGCSEETFPPPTRQLTREQVNSIWAKVRDSGLLDPTGEGITPAWRYKPDPNATACVVSFTAQGVRVSAVLTPNDANARKITEALAQLAWISG